LAGVVARSMGYEYDADWFGGGVLATTSRSEAPRSPDVFMATEDTKGIFLGYVESDKSAPDNHDADSIKDGVSRMINIIEEGLEINRISVAIVTSLESQLFSQKATALSRLLKENCAGLVNWKSLGEFQWGDDLAGKCLCVVRTYYLAE